MKQILILGVGKSSVYLLEYLNSKAKVNNWAIVACDHDAAQLTEKTQGLMHVKTLVLDISETQSLNKIIGESDIVVSMLPAFMHPKIAELCLKNTKHLATASYVSPEMRALDTEAKKQNLIFLNEMGLDPGIDHMSALKLIHELQNMGAEIESFESYCGGLVQLDDCTQNPWGYKFSWNPRNVILAGQGGMSVYKKDNVIRCIPWNRVFAESVTLDLGSVGLFDAYPNRDSLNYLPIYGLENTHTFIRGTLRRNNFCKAWQVLVELGFTEDLTELPHEINTPQKLTTALIGDMKEEKFSKWLLQKGLINDDLKHHFDFLSLDDNASDTNLNGKTAALKLQQWLTKKWELQPEDKDEVVMNHRIGYRIKGVQKKIHSTLRLLGDNALHTAMAKTVGLPLAIGVEMILTDQIKLSGVQIPVSPEWYHPVISALETEGVVFNEVIS